MRDPLEGLLERNTVWVTCGQPKGGVPVGPHQERWRPEELLAESLEGRPLKRRGRAVIGDVAVHVALGVLGPRPATLASLRFRIHSGTFGGPPQSRDSKGAGTSSAVGRCH